MTAGSRCGARIVWGQVPFLDGVTELARQGMVPGGTQRNLAYVEPSVTFDAAIDSVQRLLLADAQTSGGLLLAVPSERAARLTEALRVHDVPIVAEIGEIVEDPGGRITVGR